VITTAQAMVLALQAVRANKIALVTPYQDLVNDQLKLFLTESGVDIAAFNSLYAANVDELGKITSDAVARMARATMHEGCDALFIACSQLPTLDILGELSAEFSRPVLSSIQATAWRVRQVLAPLTPPVIPAQAGSL
jgi:arylmalonate decarboxylase